MAATSAHTKTYGSAQALAGNLIHNERAWSEDHPAPGYLLAPEHCDARGNQYIKTDLTPDRVIEEYLATNRYGRKHGRVHHKARPLRESVVVCKDTTGRQDVRRLMKSLESGLGIRCMYAHLHRDEGYISKKTGKPVLNYHIHVGYTNLVDGKLVHMDQEKMGRMQDICATALGMERGAPRKETKRRHLNPSEYRRMAREKDEAVIEVQGQLENEQEARRRVDDECNILDDENRTLRGEKVQLEGQINHMKATREAEVTTLARLKNDPDLDLGEGLDTIEDLATKLVEKNRELRQRLTDSKKGSPAIFHQLKELKTTDLPIPEKILAMTRFVDETVREDTPALPPTAAVEKPDRQEKSESESTPDSGTVDFDDIELPEISEIRARKAYAKEQPPAQSPAPVPAPTPATPSLTEEVDIWLKQQAWERKQRKAIEAERNEERLAREAVEAERDREKNLVKTVIKERTDIHNQSLKIGQNYIDLETKHETLNTAHQQLKSDYEYLRHLFQPLIKIWNNLQEHRGTEGSWLKAACKVAANVADKFMAEKPGVTPRQYRDQTPEQTPKPQQRGVRIPEH